MPDAHGIQAGIESVSTGTAAVPQASELPRRDAVVPQEVSKTMRHLLLAGLLLLTPLASTAEEGATDCDRVASHPDDPDRAAPGVERGAIDLPAALVVCAAQVERSPDDARARYQLARLLFYSGQNEAAMVQMRAAADAGYRQAQFVYGTFISYRREHAPDDICLTEKYWLAAARAGRQAARVSYVRHFLKGKFAGCPMGASRAEMTSLLDAAAREARDFYERILVEDLTDALAQPVADEQARH